MPPPTAASSEAPDELFQRALAEERLQNARRLNLYRMVGVGGFLVVSAVMLATGAFTVAPSLAVFACYWALAVLMWWASRRSERVAWLGGPAIPVVDMPMVSLLILSTTMPLRAAELATDASQLAFHVPVYFVGLLFLASLSLERRQLYVAALVACVLQAMVGWVSRLDANMLPLAIALSASMFADGGARTVRLVQRVASEQLRWERLTRYFSPQVAARLNERGELGGAGESREVTILFADLRDFTALAESLPPGRIVEESHDPHEEIDDESAT